MGKAVRARGLRAGVGLGGLALGLLFAAPAHAQQATPGDASCPVVDGVATCSGVLTGGVTYFDGTPAVTEIRIEDVTGPIAPPGYFAIGYTPPSGTAVNLIVEDGVVINTFDSPAFAGPAQAIVAFSSGGADVSVNTGATVTVDGGMSSAVAIELLARGAGADATLLNRGAVTVMTGGEGAIALSASVDSGSTGVASVTNSGTLTVTSNGSGEREAAVAGIRVLGNAGGSRLLVDNSGAITINTGPDSFDTDFQGIAAAIVTNAFAPTSETVISNSATLTGVGPNASGIVAFVDNFDEGAPSTLTIDNTGVIDLSDGFDSFGILAQVGGRIGVGEAAVSTVENAGAITATGARDVSGGYESYQLISSINTVADSVARVTNSGDMTAGGDASVLMRGIGMAGGFSAGSGNNASYDWQIVNSGDMTFTTGAAQGITMFGSRGDTIVARIENSGDFDFTSSVAGASNLGESQGIRASFGFNDPDEAAGGSSTLTIVNSGDIAMGAGNAIIAEATSTTIDNSGMLSTSADGAHVVTIAGSGPAEGGSPPAQTAAFVSPQAVAGTTLDFVTSGDIVATGADADAVQVFAVDSMTIEVEADSRVQSGTGTGSASFRIAGDPSTVEMNVAGSVLSADGTAIEINGDGVFNLTVGPMGLIEGAGAAIMSSARSNITVLEGGAGADEAGVIRGDIVLSEFDDVVSADATSIFGAVLTGGGDDLVTFTDGSVLVPFSRAVDLGEGDDRLRLVDVFLPGDSSLVGGAGFDTVSVRHSSSADGYNADISSTALLGFEELLLEGGTFGFTGANADLVPRIRLTAGTFNQGADLGNVDLVTAAGTNLMLGGEVADLTVGGMLALGGSAPVTRAVNGDLTFRAGSIYDVRITPEGAGDRIDASGSVTIEGGTVNTLAGAGEYVGGESYVILTGAEGVTGEFDGLTVDRTAFLDILLVYEANQVRLVLQENDVDFESLARTYNQRSASVPLMDFRTDEGEDTRTVYSEFQFLQEAEVPPALDAVSGEIHASLLGAGLRTARALPQAMASRARGSVADGIGYWASGLILDGDIDGDGNAATVRHDRAGIALGADWSDTNGDVRIGIAGGWSSGDVEVDGRRSRAEIEAWHLGAYARVGSFAEGLSGRAAIGWSMGDAETERRILFGGIDRTARADYGVDTIAGEAELRFGLPLGGGFAVGPAATADYARVSRDDFGESGADSLDLAGRDDADDRWAVGAGGFLGWRGEGGSFDLVLLYDHADGTFTDTPLGYRGLPGNEFLVRSPHADDDGVAVRTAADFVLGGGWRLGAGYRGRFGGGDDIHAALVTLSLR